MLCSLLMFIVVAINIFVYLLTPQYAIYGDQHYASITNVSNSSIRIRFDRCLPCQFRMAQLSFNRVRNSSPQVGDVIGWERRYAEFDSLFVDQCQMTVMGRIILRFFYKVWFFGAVYFCLSWLFLVVSQSSPPWTRVVHIVSSGLRRQFLSETLSTSWIEHSRIHRGTTARRWRWWWRGRSINTVKELIWRKNKSRGCRCALSLTLFSRSDCHWWIL